MLTVATVNVNGIRAAAKRGIAEWVDEVRPDILALQEVRATEPQMEKAFTAPGTTHLHPSRLAGRSGVAVISRLPHTAVRTGLSAQEPDVDTGRWLEVDLEVPGLDVPLTVVSAYLHSGTVGTEKMDFKYAHLARVSERLATLRDDVRSGRREILVMGDFNIVHTERDIKNWKPNYNKTAGVLQDEIDYLDRWFGELGFVDVHRALAGEVQGPYTWWSWRGKAFDNDAGWRIDYQMASPRLADAARTAEVGRAPSYAERFSDHAPLVIGYEL
ncbi:MAG: exodeoxyribonuclease III [Bowdeniella nasicola]|nr:exodeoxyribonuclease III [Bowdeniella nasicola]